MEIKVIRKATFLRALNKIIFQISSKFIILLTLVAFVLTGNDLTADKVYNTKFNQFNYTFSHHLLLKSKVFLSVALFSNIRLIMTNYFPQAIATVAEAIVSIQRIEVDIIF